MYFPFLVRCTLEKSGNPFVSVTARQDGRQKRQQNKIAQCKKMEKAGEEPVEHTITPGQQAI
jgi:hypothetical protein